MNRVFGKKECYVPIREDESRTIISYDYVAEEDGVNATWYEIYVYKVEKQTIGYQEVCDAIIEDINARVSEKILTGYQWKVLHGEDEGLVVNVWLSTENQANYKAKHDTALQYPQLTEFPMQYKIGEYEEQKESEEGEKTERKKRPVYEYFANIQELAQFYLGGVAFIESCYKEGWAKKDSMDFTPYEEALNPESKTNEVSE